MTSRPSAPLPSSVLIVGGAGFIGSHLVDRLLADGSRVDVVDDLSSGTLSHLAHARSVASDGALRIHTLDATISEFGEILRLQRPDVVYITAILNSSMNDSQGASKSFAIAASTLDAALRARVKKVVVLLPAGVLYGEVPARELPVKEDRQRRPVGVAGVVALAVIELLELYRRDHGIEFTVLALSTVYGLRQHPSNNVVSRMIQARRTGMPGVINGDGKQTRDFIYVDDAVDAASRALSKGGGLLLHIGSGQQTSIRDLWTLIGEGAPATTAPKPAHDLLRVALSASRARLHLGWSSWTQLGEGIKMTMNK